MKFIANSFFEIHLVAFNPGVLMSCCVSVHFSSVKVEHTCADYQIIFKTSSSAYLTVRNLCSAVEMQPGIQDSPS